MIRVVFVGPDRTRTFELFRRITQYPHAQTVNPAVTEVNCQSKTFEVWCTNGDAFESGMLYAKDAVYVAVIESAYAEMQRPWYAQQFGSKLYTAELDGSIITTLDTLNQRMYVDAQFSAVECLMRDIAMKTHVMQMDVLTQIRTGRTFCVDKTVISPKSLSVWMDYMLSLGTSVIRISTLQQPSAAELAIRLMSDLRICVFKGDVVIVPHFSSTPVRRIVTPNSIVIGDFIPDLSLIGCLSRLRSVLDFEACTTIEASKRGVYLATSRAEITIEAGRVTVASPDAKHLSTLLRVCTENLGIAQFSCHCNFCRIGVVPRHYCDGRIECYGYPLKGILTFIQRNTMQCSIDVFEHIAIVKPREKRISLFDGGALLEHFEANRTGVHIAYVNGQNLISLESNFEITPKHNVWIKGVEYECVNGVLQNFVAKPAILNAGISGYLSLPYAIPCLSTEPPPYPALQYVLGFVADARPIDYYTADGATAYKSK